ncbi:UNVERIFIED_CONTAM: Kinesin-like protein KIN-12D [Sesamum angustifolium]|uniref:Kinesin-like protein KIN-12D n=1 Tax=Sesamum angustifolium TaxID=2727405 RepID=A0AAW2QCZ5_9LAMI
MLRDFKFLRRNSSKNTNTEEVENVPVNPRDSLNPQMSTDPSRPPLNAIQEPSRIPKSVSDQDVSSFKASKIDRTPTKPKPKHSDTSMPFRTPEKQGAALRSRFNWAQKSEHPSTNSAAESREDGRLVSNINTPGSTRAASRANLSYSECNSTQSTPTKSVNKPPNPSFCLASGSRALNAGARMANYAALSKGIPSSSNLSTVVNTVEVPYFELKEDPSFWMEHNVQVLIRIRPLNNMEKSSFGFNRCFKQESAQSITWIGQPETRFMFDHVACEAIDQETLFRMVGLPMVENCLSGYNSCMFAYGQTGSGKTYTMLGEIEELEVKPSPNRGMTPRIFEFLFARIRAEEESRRDEHLKYNCKCSFLEIYNEQITDLLDPSSTNLMLREDMKKGVYVENLSEFEVHTVGDILQLLTQGSSNRKVAATNMNRESSRSHSVFTCVIESRWEKDSATNFRFARLNLVDLAGSERQKSSGAEGERLKEAANINKSLSTLGHVIMVLVDVAHGKPRHVPYRDSRLTFLLQDSLGGNSKTTIIANVSPSICSAAETLNTLKFAQRAKLIQNNAIINEDSSGDVTALKHQIQLLKEELSALKREKVSRSLSFGPAIDIDTRNKDADDCIGRMVAQEHPVNMLGKESHGVLRVSCKQLKSLETTLAGSLRREQMAETSIKQLEAEIEQLNRLVSQREEDTRCTKMMLKFREDKIQRMESLVGGLISEDAYLLKENNALMEENQLLRARIDKNPEVTRFALENIRLLEQVRRFQDLYEEGEREMLMTEISELRNQLLEAELDDAKVVAAQKTIEASCILEKFEEVQDTVKEADVMINELMIANETLKLNAHELKAKENHLTNEKNILAKEVQSLKLSNNLKDQNYRELEKQYDTDFVTMKRMLSELEDVISEFQTTSMEEWMSVAAEFSSVKSQLHDSTRSIRTLLEEVWSEIIVKDCAVSVLHLCHMGILLETANGLNAENGLLHHGLCESNSIISELREHNFRSRRELEMCRVLKGKLLADIKKSFDRISSKVDEAGEVTLKLTSFEKKIKDLQFQEEVMLQVSNNMGSELAVLMKELDHSNKHTMESILDQEKLLKEKDELFQHQEENFMIELSAKDFELLILSSELKQTFLLKTDAEKTCISTLEVLEDFKKDIVFKSLDAASSELLLLDQECKFDKLMEDFKMKESALETSSSHISELYQQINTLHKDIRLLKAESHRLQIELERKHEELGGISCLEKEKVTLQDHLKDLKAKYGVLLQELEDKKADLQSSLRGTHELGVENQRLRDKVLVLENCIAKLEDDVSQARVEIKSHELSESVIKDDLCLRIQDLQRQLGKVNSLKEENISLRNEMRVHEINESEYLNAFNLTILKTVDFAESLDTVSCKIVDLIKDKFIEVDDTFQKIVNELGRTDQLLEHFEYVENLAMQMDSEILSLQMELSRKDDILKGLLFDLSLLQESASNSKDQKDEMEKLLASFRVLEKEFELKSLQLDKAVGDGRILEHQLQERIAKISALELDLTKDHEIINSLSNKNAELLAGAKDALDTRNLMEKELLETRIKIENLEVEVAEMETALSQMSETTESLKSSMDTVTFERDELEGKVLTLTKELELARALAEENEAIAAEAQEIAEFQKGHAEEKEEEVKLLERSIEELECTINVLEQKVDFVKGEAERQRLQREELELELLGVKEQMHTMENNDSDVKRCLAGKEKNLQEALQRLQLLEKEIASRDAEISQCKAHISELNLHAEAQASEYKQKFKALEAMVELVKLEAPATSSSSNKLERNASKPRGSGSPFKCIGLGLVQQIKSERDEELTAGRQRIEELEALASSRQKEIFMLKARLAATESMTHDVIRDLLGVKLNMKSYAETEEERLQLAQKLLGLCTTVLKAAGITQPTSEISPSAAEAALELENRVICLERELQDVKLKNRISEERIRLSELRPQSATASSRADDNYQVRNGASQPQFLSPFDR